MVLFTGPLMLVMMGSDEDTSPAGSKVRAC